MSKQSRTDKQRTNTVSNVLFAKCPNERGGPTEGTAEWDKQHDAKMLKIAAELAAAEHDPLDVEAIAARAKRSWYGSFKAAAADVDALLAEVAALRRVAEAAEHLGCGWGDRNLGATYDSKGHERLRDALANYRKSIDDA